LRVTFRCTVSPMCTSRCALSTTNLPWARKTYKIIISIRIYFAPFNVKIWCVTSSVYVINDFFIKL
jgi:hypothetical protein